MNAPVYSAKCFGDGAVYCRPDRGYFELILASPQYTGFPLDTSAYEIVTFNRAVDCE